MIPGRTKRQKEQQRQERNQRKQADRETRRKEKAERGPVDRNGVDPDIAGIVPGPQPIPHEG